MIRDPGSLEHERRLKAEFPERKFRLQLSAADAIIRLKPEQVVDRIAPRVILFIGVIDDALVPTQEALALYAPAREPKALKLLPSIGHHDVYYSDILNEVLSAAIGWCDQYLKEVRWD
jgi:fermentation-respiration switch protein FrsA (DUF1100 family)